RAHAFLRRGGARVVALFEAEEHVLELVHLGVGKKQRGIPMRHQRRAAQALVPLALEEAQKHLADLIPAEGFRFGVARRHVCFGGVCGRIPSVPASHYCRGGTIPPLRRENDRTGRRKLRAGRGVLGTFIAPQTPRGWAGLRGIGAASCWRAMRMKRKPAEKQSEERIVP